MGKLTKTERETLNSLYKKYGLDAETHIFESAQYKIITRAGIDKIQAGANIDISYTVDPHATCAEENKYVVKAVGVMKNANGEVVKSIETYGEAAEHNYAIKVARSSGKELPWYPMAMAEKRAMSRCVLKLAGLYEHGVFSEDEADDFGEEVRKRGKQRAQKATVKTGE